MKYPHVPGAQDTDTSREARDSIREEVPLLRGRCLAALRVRPMTADEVAAHIHVSILSARPRLTELAALGRVRDSGVRRRNASGRNAIVWERVEHLQGEQLPLL